MLELCTQTLLSAQRAKNLDNMQIQRIFREVGIAMEYVSSKRITHHDIKPANIFLRADGSAALGDFGSASGPMCLKEESVVVTTISFAPP